MYWMITAVFKTTIGWLVEKGREKVAEKLKYGDVTDQRLRGIIIREIDDVKSKLDGISKKELKTSISSFREGIEYLYKVFEETRSRDELTEYATRQLATAKDRFKFARQMATIAFSNEVLSTTDRILAMQYRVMATVLETIDHPADAVASCRVCIEELNSLPVVQQSLQEQLRTGIMAVKGLFSKEERRKVISGVCLINRVVYDVTQTVSVKEPLPQWPMIDTGKEKVDLLRDRRVTKILCKQDTENCSVSWILGHFGEEEHRLNNPLGIATNSSGQYIVADCDKTIKVFDKSGKFVQRFRVPAPLLDDMGKQLSFTYRVVHLVADMNDNIYVPVKETSCEDSYWNFKFNKTADEHNSFRVRTVGCECKLSVSDSGKVVVLKRNSGESYGIVDVYEANGQFVCSFGRQILSYPCDTTTVSDGRVMVVEGWLSTPGVHIFSEQGDHLNRFDLQRFLRSPKIAFHRESQQVVVAGNKESDILYVGIYTRDGEFVRSTLIHMGESFILNGIAVTTEGHIAVVTRILGSTKKVIII